MRCNERLAKRIIACLDVDAGRVVKGIQFQQLRDAGHNVRVGEPWSESRMSACSRERDGSGRLILRAAANPRGMQGYAVGR